MRAARVAGDMLGAMQESRGENRRRGHSYYDPGSGAGAGEEAWIPARAEGGAGAGGRMGVAPLYPDQDYTALQRSLQPGQLWQDSRFQASNRLLTENSGGQNYLVSYM